MTAKSVAQTPSKAQYAGRLPVLLKRTPFSTLSEITGAGIKGAYGNNMIVWFTTDDSFQGMELRGDRRVFVALLKRLLHILDIPEIPGRPTMKCNRITPAASATLSNWDWLTPELVIEKFRKSPNLHPMLSDVEAVLRPMMTDPPAAPDDHAADVERVKAALLPDDLFRDGKPVRGAQSKVARVLGVQNAGGYRKRIQSVLQAMQQRAA